MLAILAVGAGGTLGALSRYGADRLIEHHLATVFPWSTFVINVTGCFLAGLTIVALVDRHHEPSWLGLGLVTGFLGAFTTFSTFEQETYHLGTSHLPLAAAYVAVSVTAGLVGVWAGALAGRHL